MIIPINRWLCTLLLLLSLLILASCGGEESVADGSLGSGGTGVVWGDVTGFGSIIVGGVEYDDSAADVVSGSSSGAVVRAQPQLGQQVALRYELPIDGSGTLATIQPDQIWIRPQLIGPVTAVDIEADALTLLDTQVVVSASTLLDGISTLRDLQLGDQLELHGHWMEEEGSGGRWLAATRLQRRSDRDAQIEPPLLFSGVVTAATTTRVTVADRYHFFVDHGHDLSAVAVDKPLSIWIDPAYWQPASGNSMPLLAIDWAPNLSAMDQHTIHPPPRTPPPPQLKGVITVPTTWADGEESRITLRNTELLITADLIATSGCAEAAPGSLLYLALIAKAGALPLSVTEIIDCSADIPDAGVGATAGYITAIDREQGHITLERAGARFELPLTDLARDQLDLEALQGVSVALELEWRDGEPRVRRIDEQHAH